MTIATGLAEPDEDPHAAQLLRLIKAKLPELARKDPRAAEIFIMKYLKGLPEKEIAGNLGLPTRTVKRDLHWAKAWLAKS